MSTVESERTQLQNQISQLNGVIIALNEQSEQSDTELSVSVGFERKNK